MKEQKYSGQLLYHYTGLEGLRGILKSGRIRATAIQDLADETELIYGRDLVARQFELEAKRSHEPPVSSKLEVCAKCTRALPNISELIRLGGHDPISDDARFEWYIACFSENRDALPLWRGFTDRCTGYALGLRYRSPSDWLSPFIHWPPKRVIYSQTGQRLLVRDTVANARKMLDDPHDPFAWTTALENILILKNRLFSSEREWRVVWSESKDHSFTKGAYPSHDVTRDVHYVELPLSDWELVEIICGPRAELRADAQEIQEGIKTFGGQPDNVRVIQSACRLWR